jgi:predicted ATPase
MNNEDDEFNRIEREADMRLKAVRAALKEHNEHLRANMSEYERGVIDGMQKQMQSSVDKAVNAMAAQKEWQGLTHEERKAVRDSVRYSQFMTAGEYAELVQKATESALQEKNA